MNVTEKQKQILINFMQQHPDFGRGRLRYNHENKKRMDELWEDVTSALNCAGCGPQKSSKEWAKTWRDWKSNLLKKVAVHKRYASGTGGGPPKTLNTSPSEDDLLEFLTPDASGISGVPEGGAIGDDDTFSFVPIRPALYKSCSQSQKASLISQNIQKETSKKTMLPRLWDTASSWQINVEEHPSHSDVMNIDTENLPINTFPDVLTSIENVQEQTSEQAHCINISTTSTTNKQRYSDDRDTSNKKIKKQDVKRLFEQHTSDYSNIQDRMLQLNEEKMALAKKKFEFKKKAHQEHMDLLISLIEKVDELTNIARSIAPQYLE